MEPAIDPGPPAMIMKSTRKETLTSKAIVSELPGQRKTKSAPPPPAPPELLYRHERATLQEVDLGLAGRSPVDKPVHCAIAALTPGDPLKVRIANGENGS